MKRIAITVSRGLIVRNILKTDAFALLAARGDVKFIFFVLERAIEDFKKEWTGASVEMIPIKNPITGRFKSLFLKIFSRNLVWTDSTKIISSVGKFSDKNKTGFPLKTIFRFVGFLGRFNAVVWLYRWVDAHLFPEHNYDYLFRKQKIDLIFLPDVNGKIDTAFIRSARRFGVPSIAMTKGWDTLCQRLLRSLPDRLIVQSEPVRKDARTYQRMPESRIFISGFPQFDFYRRTEWLLSRAEYCRKIGLDPARAILFFGSSGAWSNRDAGAARLIHQGIAENAFGKPCQLILRPHFSNAAHQPYKEFMGARDVFIADQYRPCNFIDNWNPSDDEIVMFVNMMHHTDIFICYVSTLALDAAILDKPLINLMFGGQFDREGRDVTWRLFQRTHYQYLAKTGGARIAHTRDELFKAVNNYLKNPAEDAPGRGNIRKYWCAGSDGLAGCRIAEYITHVLNQ